jgi:hypothetical protein
MPVAAKFVAIRWADNNGQPYCPTRSSHRVSRSAPGAVYDSNAAILAAAVEEAGGSSKPLGIGPDDEIVLSRLVAEGSTAFGTGPSCRACPFVRGSTERKPGLHRLSAGGRWIRTSGSGASGEADAILPVKDRPR